jgi:hypothetical protein
MSHPSATLIACAEYVKDSVSTTCWRSTPRGWHNLRRNGTLRTSELEAVQIVLPPTFFCSAHREARPLLDDPEARVDAYGRPPNRAERRRRRRRH